MIRSGIYFFCIMLCLMCAVASSADRSIQSIETRPGVALSYLIHTPDTPAKGVLILFCGSTGEGDFSGSGSDVSLSDNFLARTSPDFVKNGFAIVIVGVPSDHLSRMSDSFRTSSEHTADIQKLVQVLAEKKLGPIYLVGTSRGTLSAAYLATSLKDDRVKGLILTSSLDSVGSLPLKTVTIPVLIIHHVHDDCFTTTYGAAHSLTGRFVSSPRVNFVTVSGGSAGVGSYSATGKKKGPDMGISANPCKALSHHGFLGVEGPVVTLITDWLEGKSIPQSIGD
ncbi:MAG: hypothetical protein ABSA46_19395 [Thermodesulfovibrionales bacterium]